MKGKAETFITSEAVVEMAEQEGASLQIKIHTTAYGNDIHTTFTVPNYQRRVFKEATRWVAETLANWAQEQLGANSPSAGLPCPLCWQEEVMHCSRLPREPGDFKEPEPLDWVRPYGGPKGQQVTRWDLGFWKCHECGAHFNERDLTILARVIFKPFPWGMTEADWQRLNGLIQAEVSSEKGTPVDNDPS